MKHLSQNPIQIRSNTYLENRYGYPTTPVKFPRRILLGARHAKTQFEQAGKSRPLIYEKHSGSTNRRPKYSPDHFSLSLSLSIWGTKKVVGASLLDTNVLTQILVKYIPGPLALTPLPISQCWSGADRLSIVMPYYPCMSTLLTFGFYRNLSYHTDCVDCC